MILKRLRGILLEHWHVAVVVTVLTLVLTFPIIIYVFRTDVFWLPSDHRDIYIKIWDVWYGNQLLIGQAERTFTDQIFYPEGVSLVSHPFAFAFALLVNSLMAFVPISNALNLTFLLMIWITAVSTYIYMLYLFREKWLALFGAVVLGLSPHMLSHYYHPEFMFLATLPLSLYFFQRGVQENRRAFAIVAGLLVGVTTEINLYLFVCILIALGLGVFAFATTKWRDIAYWRLVALLVVTTGVTSALRIYPLVGDSQAFDETLAWRSDERRHDLISYVVNYSNPIAAPLITTVVGPQEQTAINPSVYLGVVSLALVCLGLVTNFTRRPMFPWLLLFLLFFCLSLGTMLVVNGTIYPDFPLPKRFLNQWFPAVFGVFYEPDHFIMGLLLPLAVLATFGLSALQRISPRANRPGFVLILIGIVAADNFVPVQENLIEQEQFAFLDWLADQEDQDIRLINVPMGRHDAKRYNLYQALSGYPSAEGAISRTPEAAFDYIYASPILGEWRDDRPAICGFNSSDEYLAALDKLVADGFTHVVYHRKQRDAQNVTGSFAGVSPAYHDDYVSIYHIGDLREHCPRHFIPNLLADAHAVELLLLPSVIHERHGTIIGFQNDLPADEQQLRLTSRAFFDQKDIVNISSAENGDTVARSSHELYRDLAAIHATNDALWLVNNPHETDLRQQAAYNRWLLAHYKFCQRHVDRDSGTIDLYLRLEIPCEAAESDGENEVVYDNGIRLHDINFEVTSEELTIYLAWTNALEETYSFSLQFRNASGEQALQFDHVIERQFISAHRFDVSELSGDYELALIVYEFHTGKSVGGTLQSTQQRFEREAAIASIKL